MNLSEASIVIRKVENVWPQASALNGGRAEWLEFLAGLEYLPVMAAVTFLRDTLKWRPSMAELKDAYLRQAASIEEHKQLDESRQLLPGSATQTDPRKRYTLLDVYGASKERWVYCSECCMAISLEEQATTALYTQGQGLRHDRCPHAGAAPMMPATERNEREAYWQRYGIGKNRDSQTRHMADVAREVAP